MAPTADPTARRPARWGRRILVSLVVAAAGLVVVALTIALWGSRGHLPAVIDGQFDPGPALTDLDVSARPPALAPVSIEISVDTSTVLRRVDERYLSFAIDTSAVVGGKWWDPEASGPETGSGTVNAPVFDFDRERLDTLTRALAPAFLRIGGSEADKVYYDMSPGSATSSAPEGFESVLTRRQWDSVNAFARRNQLALVMTLNAGPGSRDPNGQWDPDQASALLTYSRQQGYEVYAWELGNELNLFWFIHGLDAQVDPETYVDDLRRLRRVVEETYPHALVSGQAAAFWPVLGEPLGALFGFQADYARLGGTATDIFAWHYYPQQSRRGPVASRRAAPGRLLDPHNLDEAAHWADHNAQLRDAYSPGRPLWLAETGNAQFGGEPGLSDRYLASLWWLDQLGLLAVHHHDVVVRQTLAGSNYQLLTADTLEPLPDYWASLLWKKLMGRRVLAVQATGSDRVRAYAHWTPNTDAVTLLVINLNHRRSVQFDAPGVPGDGHVYAVTAENLFGTEVRLNGAAVTMVSDTELPELKGVAKPAQVLVHPLSYSFVTYRPVTP